MISFDAELIDPVSGKISSLKKQVNIMLDYVSDGLKYFNNTDTVDKVLRIIKNHQQVSASLL